MITIINITIFFDVNVIYTVAVKQSELFTSFIYLLEKKNLVSQSLPPD